MRPRAAGNNLICEELGAPGPGQLLRTLRTVSSLHCECTSRACGRRLVVLILRNLAKLFLTKLNGSVTFSKLAHTTQLAKSHFHFNSHTHTFSFIPGFWSNYQVPEGGVRFFARLHTSQNARQQGCTKCFLCH